METLKHCIMSFTDFYSEMLVSKKFSVVGTFFLAEKEKYFYIL